MGTDSVAALTVEPGPEVLLPWVGAATVVEVVEVAPGADAVSWPGTSVLSATTRKAARSAAITTIGFRPRDGGPASTTRSSSPMATNGCARSQERRRDSSETWRWQREHRST